MIVCSLNVYLDCVVCLWCVFVVHVCTLNKSSAFRRGSSIVCNTEVGSNNETGRLKRLTMSFPISPVSLENNFFLSSCCICSSFNSYLGSSSAP